jgi:hypothetical protein
MFVISAPGNITTANDWDYVIGIARERAAQESADVVVYEVRHQFTISPAGDFSEGSDDSDELISLMEEVTGL